MTVTLFHGDCLDVLPTIEAQSIDAVITDPPFGIDYQSARRTDRTQWKPKVKNDKEPFIEWIKEAYRVTKDGGALICFYRWDVGEVFRKAIEDAGYSVKSQIIWDKVAHGMGDLKGSFAPRHENAWFATKGSFEFWNNRPQDVIRCARVSAEKLVHPNEKPVDLFTRLIDSVVPLGGSVLDCFMGAGASGCASLLIQRNYTGIELMPIELDDPNYFGIAEKRIRQAQSARQLNLV